VKQVLRRCSSSSKTTTTTKRSSRLESEEEDRRVVSTEGNEEVGTRLVGSNEVGKREEEEEEGESSVDERFESGSSRNRTRLEPRESKRRYEGRWRPRKSLVDGTVGCSLHYRDRREGRKGTKRIGTRSVDERKSHGEKEESRRERKWNRSRGRLEGKEARNEVGGGRNRETGEVRIGIDSFVAAKGSTGSLTMRPNIDVDEIEKECCLQSEYIVGTLLR
jgi:hypothetical protein